MADDTLESVYRNTDYVVNDPDGRFIIRVGEVADIDTDRWAFISACNPKSVPLTDAENAARMRELERLVVAAGHVFLYGNGKDRDGQWPEEPSLLIFGLDESTAVAWAARFDQAAIVTGERGQPARLTWVEG